MILTIGLLALIYLGVAMCFAGYFLNEMPEWHGMDQKMRRQALMTAGLTGLVWPAIGVLMALSSLQTALRKLERRPKKAPSLRKDKK